MIVLRQLIVLGYIYISGPCLPREFQELNNCLIDKAELTTLIVGEDWDCTLTKKDKKVV